MEPPETHYARRGELHIGYQVWGEGATDILDLGFGTYISIDETGGQSQWRRYTERLAACGRIIRFDPSGIGLSDTPSDLAGLTFGSWVDDALAVMDAAGATRVVVLAASGCSFPAFLLAAEHPQCVESLIVVNASARYTEADDYPIGIPIALMEEFQAGLDPDSDADGTGDLGDLRLFAPSALADPEFQRWWSGASGAAPPRRYPPPGMRSPRSPTTGISSPASPRRVWSCIAGTRSPPPSTTVGTSPTGYPRPGSLRCREATSCPSWGISTGSSTRSRNSLPASVTSQDRNGCSPRSSSPTSSTPPQGPPAWATADGPRSFSTTTNWSDVSSNGSGVVSSRTQETVQSPRSTHPPERFVVHWPYGTAPVALVSRCGAGCIPGRSSRVGTTSGVFRFTLRRGIAEAAPRGEVLASEMVVDLVEGSGVKFENRGWHELKGVSGPRRLWSALEG